MQNADAESRVWCVCVKKKIHSMLTGYYGFMDMSYPYEPISYPYKLRFFPRMMILSGVFHCIGRTIRAMSVMFFSCYICLRNGNCNASHTGMIMLMLSLIIPVSLEQHVECIRLQIASSRYSRISPSDQSGVFSLLFLPLLRQIFLLT